MITRDDIGWTAVSEAQARGGGRGAAPWHVTVVNVVDGCTKPTRGSSASISTSM